ncbi:MAG: hypothetical protein CL727_07330 [Chloroflexi bacterium]|nr:hypothetical protein [Chloroflexota bacterium]
MNKRFSSLVFLSVLIAAGYTFPIDAQTMEERLVECSEIQVSLIRLQCYDRLAKAPNKPQTKQSTKAKQSTRAKKSTRIRKRLGRNKDKQQEQASDQSTARETSSELVAQEQQESSVSGNKTQSGFGDETMPNADSDPKPGQITSRIIGEFGGWNGETVFELENGQVWQQSSNGLLIVKLTNPRVTIKKARFSYKLSVEGYNASVSVRKIK